MPTNLRRLFLAIALCSPGVPAGAWELDTLLNEIQIDARSPKRHEETFLQSEPAKPLGQAFKTGADVEKVFRIAIWQAFWHKTWQPDEILVMTLWDSPQKTTHCGRFAVPYSRRMWENATVMFTLDARVQPNRTYYFELTVETDPLRPAELPREWLLSGKRPGITGGDQVLGGIGMAKADYPDGCAYIGGAQQSCDLWFEVHVRRTVDRDALYAQAFSLFDLDYPPLASVRDAVARKDWNLAVSKLIKHFESRTDIVDPARRVPRYDPAFKTLEADLAADQKVLQENGPPEDLGPNWNYYALWPERGGVGLTRGGMRKPLAEGYTATGNDKYARAFNDMLGHFYTNCPSPARAGMFPGDGEIPSSLPAGLAGGSMWSALSIGARLIHGFHYYATFADSPLFETSIRAKWIFDIGEMAEVLGRMHGGGNWETQISDALFEFGLRYPEFKGAAKRIESGLARIGENAAQTVRPDGALQEPTINYHLLVLNRYSKVVERCRALKRAVPQQLDSVTERMFQFVMYGAMPDGTLPTWGDSNHPFRAELLERGANLYGREDFRFVFSRGKQGRAPERLSYGFADGGFYYMRTSWDSDAQYLAFRAGPFGSHGHSDPLSIIAAAYGRTVLIDPGIHTYGSPQAQELSSTASHNTVTVDNRSSRSSKADAWVTAANFDFAAGHNSGYEGLKDVTHHRRVWFLKPVQGCSPLWAVLDDVVGAGSHAATLRYRFAPLSVREDAKTQRVWTEGDGGNLLICAKSNGDAKLSLDKGIAVWNGLTQVPVASFGREGPLPVRFASLLAPFRGAEPPRWELRPLSPDTGSDGATVLWAEASDEALLLASDTTASLHEAPTTMRLKLPDGRTVDTTAAATAMRFTRTNGAWTPLILHAVRVRSVSLGDKRLFESNETRESIDQMLR